MPKKKQKYQNLIYVQISGIDDGEVYANYDLSEIAEAGSELEIGIYQFVKTAKVRTKIEVV